MKRIFQHPPRPERPVIWRSLAELENSPAFQAALEREFPRGAEVYEAGGLTKRDFMKLLGASMTLAGIGLTGCRRPEAYLVPFNKGVEWTVPGKFLFYATAMPLRQGAMPLIVSTVDGRPTKIEGNPLHPWSNGGTDGFAQASVLDLYDPNRSKVIKKNGFKVGADVFENFLNGVAGSNAGDLAFLVERKNSPTRERLRAELESKHPGLIWCEYEPLGSQEADKAIAATFGDGIRLLPKLEKADLVVALDSEFLNPSEKGVGFAQGFFSRRNPDQNGEPMNRLYVVENHYTGTGGLADHRYRCKASLIGEFARQLGTKVAEATGSSSLASLLGVDSGISARRVDEREQREPEFLGELHEAQRLAVAVRTRHAEVTVDLLLRSSASARRRLPALTTPGLPGAPRTFPRIRGVPSLLPANSSRRGCRSLFSRSTRRSATMARRSSE